jgi:hypothetical protein
MNHEYIKQFNLIDQYVLGKLATDEAEEFENHFIECPECVEQLNITRSFIHDLKGFAVQETLRSNTRPVTRWWHLQKLMPVRSWAVIACCGVVVAGVFAFLLVRRQARLKAELGQAREDAFAVSQKYQQRLQTAAESERQHQESQQQLAQRIEELEQKLKAEDRSSVGGSAVPEVNFPIYALLAVARGQVSPAVEIAPPASSSRFALSIPVEDRREFSVYRVTIVDNRGTTVWKQSGFKPDAYHALSLSLNSKFLNPGDYDLRVEGLTQSNQWNTVGSYPFRVAKRRG